MRIKARFIGFFTLGLVLFLLYVSMIVIFLLEIFLPWAGIADNTPMFIAVFTAAFVSGGALFSFCFVRPIIAMLSLVGEISAGRYNQPDAYEKLKRKNGKLKKRYWLYKELITDIDSLSGQLKQTEIERGKLEQAKQDWVQGISHDVKTPLSYIVGYSSLLLSPDHSWTQEEQQSFLSQIYQKGKYIESLINNMNLSFRLDDATIPFPLQLSTFDLIAFMENLVADMANQQANAEYSLSLQALDTHLNIEADEQLLYRAIANLIGNAIRYNPNGTEIKVVVKRNGQGNVDVSVSDNGIGIPQETLDTLFQKYHDNQAVSKGKKDYAGGLGLSIVKNIVNTHHGKISVESKVNEGTSFTINLPIEQVHIAV